MKLGVLALQGDHAAHAKALAGAAEASGRELEVVLVRRPSQLEGLAGIALPGGESTTMLKLLAIEGLDRALVDFARAGGVVLGTCAGAILLAREVRNPEQASLGLLDAVVERNGYGRQIDSFIAQLETEPELGEEPLEGVFIRAPRFRELGEGVEVLARFEGEPVLVREGPVIAASFHPELTDDTRVANLFLAAAAAGPGAGLAS